MYRIDANLWLKMRRRRCGDGDAEMLKYVNLY